MPHLSASRTTFAYHETYHYIASQLTLTLNKSEHLVDARIVERLSMQKASVGSELPLPEGKMYQTVYGHVLVVETDSCEQVTEHVGISKLTACALLLSERRQRTGRSICDGSAPVSDVINLKACARMYYIVHEGKNKRSMLGLGESECSCHHWSKGQHSALY